jgi:hypothetical protein
MMRRRVCGLRHLGLLFVSGAAWTIASCGIARANATPAPAIHFEPIRRSWPEPAPGGAVHFAFGEITKLERPVFVLRLRDGRTLDVDATAAIQSGRYSAPLFAGKFVVVKGDLDARGVMHAETVTRIERVDDATPKDR